MADSMRVAESVGRRYAVLRPHLDERQRRLMLGSEAAELARVGSRRSRRPLGRIRTPLRARGGLQEQRPGV